MILRTEWGERICKAQALTRGARIQVGAAAGHDRIWPKADDRGNVRQRLLCDPKLPYQWAGGFRIISCRRAQSFPAVRTCRSKAVSVGSLFHSDPACQRLAQAFAFARGTPICQDRRCGRRSSAEHSSPRSSGVGQLRHRRTGPSAHSLNSTIVIGRLHLAQSGQSATVAIEISGSVYEEKWASPSLRPRLLRSRLRAPAADRVLARNDLHLYVASQKS